MIKILYNNYLIDFGNTITALSGSASLTNLTDLDRSTAWQSQSSSDAITELIEIEFDDAQDLDRLMLIEMNFKDFHVWYWDEAAWADFTNVYTNIDSAVSDYTYEGAGVTYGGAGVVYGTGITGIVDSDNSLSTRYFEFDSVNTTKIRIECTYTITANDEKELNELYLGEEIGTFVQDLTSKPCKYRPVRSDTRSTYRTKSNGGTIKYERGDKYRTKISVKELLNSADQTIYYAMFDQGQFAILPCGGVPYTERGWRLQDFYHVVIKGDETAEFAIGRVSDLGINDEFELLEQ